MGKLLLLLLNGAKLSKVLVTVGSMLLSIGVYAALYGWRFGVGIVMMLFFHELGHMIAGRQRGLEVSGMAFIPFVGAWTSISKQPHDAETEAYFAMGGPVLGSLAALACYYLGSYFAEPWLQAVAYVGFFINLINLIPIKPLDGGHITLVISPKLWLVGSPLLVAYCIYHPTPLMIMLVLLSLPHVWTVMRGDLPHSEDYLLSSMETKISYGAAYLGLAAFDALMATSLHGALGS